MKIDDIDAFVAVIRNASLSQAAESLGLTQSAITRRVQSLEESLGCSAARNSSACCAINPTRLVFQWWKRNFRIARRVPPGYPN